MSRFPMLSAGCRSVVFGALWCAIFSWFTPSITNAEQKMTTVAGDGSTSLDTGVGQPFGVEFGPDGALYICEVQNHRLLRLDPRTGRVTTVAGTGEKGYSGDGGPAASARLNEPYEVRFDREGNIFFVEMQNHLVRRIDAQSGVVSTIAGTGEPGFSGDGGPAINAQFSRPHSIALDGRGGLYVADIGNHRIRRVDLKSGTIDTIAGNGQRQLPQAGGVALGAPVIGPRALFVHDDALWVALREGHSVWKIDLGDGRWHHVACNGKQGYSGDGGAAAAATMNGPKGIAFGPDGRLYVVDTENQVIRVVDIEQGTIDTFAGNSQRGYGGDEGPAKAAKMDRPHGICVGSDGAVYIGDTNNHRVRRVAP
ncbi:MAG: hypothetical protein KDA42_00545 [Planctomycetales bacterium]|nr:hypothetical protein [Planctomycetales bacterium]